MMEIIFFEFNLKGGIPVIKPCLILAAIVLAVQSAWAEPPPDVAPAASTSAPISESESQGMARARLMDMAKFLAATEKFSVTVRTGYDTVQDNGQKIEFGAIRDIAIQRPDRVRIEEKNSNGGRDLMLFDGKNINMFNAKTGLYAQAPQPGDIDATVVYFVRDLKMRLPMAPLLMSHLPEELERRLKSIDYVEQTDILGEPAHHIAARTANVDFQVWIAADSKRPLPLRIVLTYPQADAQPQFWAQFSQWNLTPQLEKTAFEFTPPSDAKQIKFAAQIPSPSSEATEQGGKP
jgi:hypothetical protein